MLLGFRTQKLLACMLAGRDLARASDMNKCPAALESEAQI